MRSAGVGGSTTALLQQTTLSPDSASVLKHSLSLARRRGHAQLTPLHVAATLLSLRSPASSSFRRACLTSSSPHQCRALDLCFNVALNRLPTSPSPPLFHHSLPPSFSNALVAALKRAQAHQRRGSLENHQQQPPLLTVKIELEQLVISILDDPSVSRVMREAGFSSTAVKNNIEQDFSFPAAAAAVFSSPSRTFLAAYTCREFSPALFPPPKKVHPSSSYCYKDDVKLVMDVLLGNKKKNAVIVGDSASLAEGLVGEVMATFERSDELKSTRFIEFHMRRDEAEKNLMELKRKVESVGAGGGGGIVVYAGDLKWTLEEGVDEVVAEMGKLLCEWGAQNGKVWLMATATCQTYMRCQMRQPPLEIQWGLHPVLVPSGGLGLTLHASSTSVLDSKMNISSQNMLEQDKLNCCEECASNYEKEAQFLRSGQKKMLPFWLQPHSTEPHHKDELTELKRKWNRLCQCLHQTKHPQNQWSNNIWSGKIHPFNSSSSISFSNNAAKPTYSSNHVPRFRRQQQSCTIEFNFGDKRQAAEPAVLGSLEGMEEEGKEVKTTLALGNGGSGESVGDITDHRTLRRAHVCKLLQENVPWHSETVPSIAESLIDDDDSKHITWLLLQGNDTIGKRRLALAIAESVFGSADRLFHLNMLKKETSIAPHSEMLAGALRSHQQLVVLIENVDFADAHFKKCLSDGFETGKFGNLGQVIFILTSGGSTRNEERDQNNKGFVMRLLLQVSETKPNLEEPCCFGQKRKAELDLFSKIKIPRIEEKEEESLVSKHGGKKKEFSRQSSFNSTLDLNMKADEEDDDITGESSPISSDLTLEAIADPMNPNGFLESIENRFEFNTSPARSREMTEMFLSKIKGSFEDVCGRKKQQVGNFSVDERMIEDLVVGCGSFTNCMFEKWLKDIFQSRLQGVEEGILFRLCLDGGKGDNNRELLDKSSGGFMSSSLPKSIQVKYFMG